MLPGTEAGLVAAMGGEGELAGLRLARGCRCFSALAGEEVVSYGWLSTRGEWIGEIRLEITPGSGEAYVWNCLTLPGHRRQGIFRAVLVRICGVLKAEGVARLWIASGHGGTVSTLAAAGFRQVLAVSELNLAGLRLLRATPAPEAEPALVFAARRALAGGSGSLASTAVVPRPGPRRH